MVLYRWEFRRADAQGGENREYLRVSVRVANSYNPVASSEVASRRAEPGTRTVDLSGVRNFDRLVSCYWSQKRANGKGSTAKCGAMDGIYYLHPR